MSRLRVFLVCSTTIGMLMLGGSYSAAQYYQPYSSYPPPRERQLDDRYEAAPDEEYYRPSERSGARLRHSYDSDEDAWQRPAQRVRPRNQLRPEGLPADADPAYSTPIDYDDEIDPNESTAQVVDDPTNDRSGAITIDTRKRKLYLSLGDGRAIEYGIGVGREGFAWKGVAQIGRKAFWPGWTPPPEMLLRRPDLPRHMDGGIDNPLGARALYLFKGSKDTLFRIHGTNEPDTIGHAVSSGCIRMLNADVIDLYRRVRKGLRVVVL